MIDRARFLSEGRPRWQRLEALLDTVRLAEGGQWTELAALYRSLCADLSRARSEDLPDDVQSYLDDLAARAHNRLYSSRRPRATANVVRFLAEEVPRQVRASALWFWIATVLFYGPFVLGIVGAFVSEDFAIAAVGEQALRSTEASYTDAPERSAAGNASMAGFYVFNNAGIGLRSFATGALAGLGTVFFLVYNGVVLGTVFGHLGRVGSLPNLLEFTSGHSAWELTAIVVSGAAGMRLGWAIIETGGRTRTASLRAAAPELFRLAVGASAMFVVAAAIEGFWSASPVPRPVKFGFGIVQIVLVASWLLLGGRARR